jgi:hypothetical protein
LEQNIDLRTVWIPRDLNFLADAISRRIDFDDHAITVQFFQQLCIEFGTVPNMDRFADDKNKKTARFNSIVYCPGTSGVDAFNYDWAVGGLSWIFPPLKLLGRALYHLKRCKGAGWFLIPQWRNSYFYPLFLQEKTILAFKKSWVDPGEGIFIQGSDSSSYFGPSFKGNIEIWWLDYSVC